MILQERGMVMTKRKHGEKGKSTHHSIRFSKDTLSYNIDYKKD